MEWFVNYWTCKVSIIPFFEVMKTQNLSINSEVFYDLYHRLDNGAVRPLITRKTMRIATIEKP